MIEGIMVSKIQSLYRKRTTLKAELANVDRVTANKLTLTTKELDLVIPSEYINVHLEEYKVKLTKDINDIENSLNKIAELL